MPRTKKITDETNQTIDENKKTAKIENVNDKEEKKEVTKKAKKEVTKESTKEVTKETTKKVTKKEVKSKDTKQKEAKTVSLPKPLLSTPVAFIIFNRPDTTKKVFDRIREAKPAKLYIISDAPRDGREDDVENVAKTRSYVENNIDWECER